MNPESQKAQFFICHASDDKDEFVRPLAKYFLKSGASIFYDEYSIKLGDSISSKINQGLKEAEVAIIVLSYAFFQKNWPEAELQALINRQISGKTRLVIIYHGVTHEEVSEQYPLLQDLYGVSSGIGIEKLANKIFEDTSFPSQLSYIRSDLDKEEIDVSKDGFSVSIRFVLSHLYDPIFDKYIFDMGQPEDWTNRFSIFIKNNRHIVAHITDENGIGLSLCCPIEAFQHEPKVFSFVICPSKASASIFVGSTLQKEVLGIPEHMLKTMNPGGSCITFNSLELVNPCPAMISYQSIGAAINAVSLSESIEKFCEAVTKSIG